ncbi:MAG: PAS domain S-box protein [Bacteroidales bacterium]|jgi:PAS domain S-box-containing protein|nr:PAS domain S-box protein [Bacteroidales bacterium]
MQNRIKQLEEENEALKEQLARLTGNVRNNSDISEKVTEYANIFSGNVIDNIQLTDIIPVEELQALQDKFAIANGVTSIIVDIHGHAVTRLSNYSDVCKSMLSAGKECYVEKKMLHGENPEKHHCSLIEAKAPIYIKGAHIADWKIGMCGFGGTIAPFVKAACNSDEQFAGLFPKLCDRIREHFENIRTMLEAMANEISNIGYNNMKFAYEEKKINELISDNEWKLKESNAVLEGIMSTIPAPLYVTDKEGYCVKCNQALLDVFGISSEQIIGQKAEDVFPEQIASTVDDDNRLQSNADHVQKETRLTTVNGVRDILALRGALHNKEGVVGIMLDITDTKEAEKKLIAEKERLQALGDNIPDGCLYRFVLETATGNMRLEYLSAAWERLSGIPAADAMADMNIAFSVVHPDDIGFLSEKIRECTTTMSNFNIEMRLKGHPVRWVQMISHPHVEGANIVWDGIIMEITRRKETERQLTLEKERMQALGDNFPNGCLFRFRILAESLRQPDAQLTWMNRLELSYASAAWEKICNVPLEEAMQNAVLPFAKIHPDDLRDSAPKMFDCLANAKDFSVEIRYAYTETEMRWFQLSASQQSVDEWIVIDGFILDITDRKTDELELDKYREELERLVKERTEELEASTEELYAINEELSATNEEFSVTNEELHLKNDQLQQEVALRKLAMLRVEAREEDLRKLVARFESVVNNYPGLIWSINKDRIIESFNGLYLKTMGLEPNFLEGKPLEEARIGNSHLDIIEYVERTFREGAQAWDSDIDGNIFSIHTAPIIDENGETIGVVGNCTDITPTIILQKNLKDSENKMRNFISQSFEGISIFDHEGRIVEWNKAQEIITGITREEAIGEYEWNVMFRLRPEEERTDEVSASLQQQCLDYIRGVKDTYPIVEDLVYTPEGESHYIQISVFPIDLAENKIFGKISHDITEKKLNDDELEQYRSQLEEMVEYKTQELVATQERLVSLSDNLSGGVIFQMLNNRFTYISANFVNMFHLDIESIKENQTLFYELICADDREKINMLLDPEDSTMMCDAECRLNNDANDKWIHVRAGCRMQNNGDRVWDGFMIDITDRKFAEQERDDIRKRQGILIKVLQIVQSAEDAVDALNRALSEIGRYAGVSRTYICEKNGEDRISNIYEWCNDGIAPKTDRFRNLPVSPFRSWFEAFEAGQYICTSDIRTLAAEVYEVLEPHGIKSVLVLPLAINGAVYGFVAFDDCVSHRSWINSETELLISLSQIISNTTRRFKAEDSILLSQQTMRTVLDNIDAHIYVSDFDSSKVLFANKKVQLETGNDIEGKHCWEVLQKRQSVCTFCPNPHLLEKGSSGMYHWEHWNENSKRWFECADSAIEWIDGRLVHMEYATDITNRKIAEDALQKSEELYRQLTVASPDAIVVCKPRGDVIYLSPKAREMFLIDREAEASALRLYHYVHPHDRRRATEIFQQFVNDNVSYLPQLLLRRSDKTEFFGEITSASVKDAGTTTSIIMVIRDITERKLSEMELIRAKEKAEESDKLKSAFLANMSHEIRTPINGIIGFLNFLNDDNLPSKRRQEYITIVNNSSTQLVKLIDDIIDVAKIEAKQMSVRPTLLSVNEFMTELQIFFETYLQANNKEKIALILDDSQFIDGCVTYVDPTRLRQVLSNLIGNAVKFTEKGFIRFGYRQSSPAMLEFVVEDSGIGLPPDQLEVIFERFRQAELTNSRKYGGTGLGLTISRSLVQMMGGDITVESVQGEGASFYFTISYLPVAPEDRYLFEEPPAKELAAKKRPFKNTSILIVEPGVMSRGYYEKLLSLTGADILFAQTLKQWTDAITQQKHIDVVLANADVLKNEAPEEIQQLKSIRAGLPLVLTIPEHNEYYRQLMTETQCNKVLEMPTNFENLYQTLKKYALAR